MTSLEDEWLQKGTIHTNKNVDSYHSCKNSDTVEYLHDKLKPSMRSQWVIPNNGVTFILLHIEVALTHSVTRHDFRWAYNEENTLI